MKLSDKLTLAGIGLVSLGAGLAYLPLGVFILGVFLLLVGLGLRQKPQGKNL